MGNIDVDDYMSDNLLEQINDVKPGITTDRNHKRMLKIENERAELQMNSRTIYNQRELEKVRREEALSKPVPESSKGFALLSKMGFKPGMSLGKKKNGLFPIIFKSIT
uniref:G-patch domain-containing protein n=1 Tax=Heterorhabditis bacteriophora TaxID=37862 RepID=A0A1I7WAR9_HETBA